MAIEPGRVKALFQAAIELDDTSERRAFLDREVGGDVELRARLDALLCAYDQSNSVLDQPLAANTDNDSAAVWMAYKEAGAFLHASIEICGNPAIHEKLKSSFPSYLLYSAIRTRWKSRVRIRRRQTIITA